MSNESDNSGRKEGFAIVWALTFLWAPIAAIAVSFAVPHSVGDGAMTVSFVAAAIVCVIAAAKVMQAKFAAKTVCTVLNAAMALALIVALVLLTRIGNQLRHM